MEFHFSTLCHELTKLHLQMLRREAAPASLSLQASFHICDNEEHITHTCENAALAPLYRRSCATPLRHVPEHCKLAALDALDSSFHLAEAAVGGDACGIPADVNAALSVVHSVMALSESQDRLNGLFGWNASAHMQRVYRAAVELQSRGALRELLMPSLWHAFQLW